LEAVDLPAGKRTAAIPANAGRVREIVFTPDKAAVLTHSGQSVSRWDAVGLKRVATRGPELDLPPGVAITTLDIRPDGKEALIAFGNRVRFLDPTTLADARPGWDTADEVLDARYTPDGKRVFAGLRNNSAVLVNAADGTPVFRPTRHARAVTMVGVNPDGTVLLTGSRSGIARFWDAATGLELGVPMRHPGPVTVVAYSPAGGRAATGTSTVPPPPLGGTLADVRAKVREWTGRASPTDAKP
jgi:WD40 repeat protein